MNTHRQELCSTEPRSKLLNHATGGSSGTPTRFFITVDSYDWRCAASERAYSWAGHRLGEKTLFLWGAPVGKSQVFKSAKISAYRWMRRELVIPTFAQTTELWEKTLRSILWFKPKFIVGYVSSLEEFAQFLIAREVTVKGVVAVIAAAEPVHQRTYRLVNQAFNAPLFNNYGSREFMSIASECSQRNGLHINAENLFVETEFPSAERPSEFLITDLHNYGMPFIRYRIGDLGRLSNDVCPCGRGLPLLRSIEGRVLEVLRTRSGRVVPGELFPHIFKEIPEIREFQVRQDSLEEIVVFLVLSRPLGVGSQTLIESEISKAFGQTTRISLRPVEAIPRTASGKRLVTLGLGSRAAVADALRAQIRTMRIVHIADSLQVGGAEVLIALLCRFQREQGHTPSVYCLDEIGNVGAQLQKEGFEVLLHRPPAFFRLSHSLYHSFKLHRPDAVHCHNARAAIVGAGSARICRSEDCSRYKTWPRVSSRIKFDAN